MKLLLFIIFLSSNGYSEGLKKIEIGLADDTLLYINRPAPFSGILVPEENYRFYYEKLKENVMINERLMDCLEIEPPRFTYYILPIMGGVLLGALLTMAVQH